MHLPEWLAAREPLPAGLRAVTLHRCIVPGDSHAYRDLTSLDWMFIKSCRSPDGAPIATLDLPVKSLTVE
jgi:hypothetical protein